MSDSSVLEKKEDIASNVVVDSVACFLVDDLTTRASIIESFSGKLIFSGKVDTTVYKEENGTGDKYLSLEKYVAEAPEAGTSFVIKKFNLKKMNENPSVMESKTNEFSNSKEANALISSMAGFSESDKKPFSRKVEKHFVRGLEITIQELTKKNLAELEIDSKFATNYVITMKGSGAEIVAWIAMMGVKNHVIKHKNEFFL